MSTVYKIVLRTEWEVAHRAGTFTGSPVDLKDGYIHLSAAHQMRETAARHFAGLHDLILVAYDAAALGAGLRWEASRGGDLFPHYYGTLDPARAAWTAPLPLAADGSHIFPPEAGT